MEDEGKSAMCAYLARYIPAELPRVKRQVSIRI
jgi:hypothetical protein